MKHIIIFSIFILYSIILKAQEPVVFTLNDCVTRAMNENIELKIRKNVEKKAMLNRQNSQLQMAPSLSGWGNSGLNLRRSTNQNNEISSGTSYNIGYGISSSINLFRGLTQLNIIAANKYNELVYSESTNYSANLLYLNILENYTLALYQHKIIDVLKERLEISLTERKRINAFIEEGKLEKVALYEIEATVSGNELSYNKAINNYKLTLIQLAQLIEWTNYENFNVSADEFALIKPSKKPYTYSSVYAMACTNLPQVKQKEYTIEYLKKHLKVSKGNRLPSLSMNAGYSSGFYSTDTLANGSPSSFSNQLSNYINPNLSLSLNIPIFNGLSKSIAVKKSKVDLENGLYELENEKKIISKEIVEAIQRLESYRLEYQSASKNLSFVEKSFEAYREKFQLGMISSTDFITAQNQLAQAQTNVINANYNWIVQHKILELYMGKGY